MCFRTTVKTILYNLLSLRDLGRELTNVMLYHSSRIWVTIWLIPIRHPPGSPGSTQATSYRRPEIQNQDSGGYGWSPFWEIQEYLGSGNCSRQIIMYILQHTTITCIYCIYIYMVEYCLPKGLVSSLCQFFLFNNLLHGAHRQTVVDTLYLLIILLWTLSGTTVIISLGLIMNG